MVARWRGALIPHFYAGVPQFAFAGDPLPRFDAAYGVVGQVSDYDTDAVEYRAVTLEVKVERLVFSARLAGGLGQVGGVFGEHRQVEASARGGGALGVDVG